MNKLGLTLIKLYKCQISKKQFINVFDKKTSLLFFYLILIVLSNGFLKAIEKNFKLI